MLHFAALPRARVLPLHDTGASTLRPKESAHHSQKGLRQPQVYRRAASPHAGVCLPSLPLRATPPRRSAGSPSGTALLARSQCPPPLRLPSARMGCFPKQAACREHSRSAQGTVSYSPAPPLHLMYKCSSWQLACGRRGRPQQTGRHSVQCGDNDPIPAALALVQHFDLHAKTRDV